MKKAFLKIFFAAVAIVFLLACSEQSAEIWSIERRVTIKEKKESIQTEARYDAGHIIPFTETVYYFFYTDGTFQKVSINNYVNFKVGDQIIVYTKN